MEEIVLKGFEMSLFTETQIVQLIENGNVHKDDHDAIPVVHLRGDGLSWIISEICDETKFIGYGISTTNEGQVVVGFLDLKKLQKIHDDQMFLKNDALFKANFPLSTYGKVAKQYGKMIIDDELFRKDFERFTL